MPFVNEDIPEEDKEWFNSFGFKSPYSGDTVEPWKWAIDRERNIFLCPLAGSGSRSMDKPIFFVMVDRNFVVKMEVYIELHGNKWDGVEVLWEIEKIFIPDVFEIGANEITELIREALTAYSYIYGPENMTKIEFKKMPIPVFIGRA